MKHETIEAIEKEKLIVILRGIPERKLLPLAQAMYEAGIRLIEITYDATGSVTDEQTARNIALLASHFKGKMHVGAGTVLTEEQVELTKKAGGTFIMSPNTDANVIRRTNDLGLVSVPGAFTPTEAQQAHLLGADFVKLFPMDAMGASYLKALRAPLSHIRFLAVGGINEDNIAEYGKAGACSFGIGSGIVSRTALEDEDYAAVKALARRYLLAIN